MHRRECGKVRLRGCHHTEAPKSGIGIGWGGGVGRGGTRKDDWYHGSSHTLGGGQGGGAELTSVEHIMQAHEKFGVVASEGKG